MLAGFQQQLSDDFQRTVERFLALQTMGTETARQDARALKKTVLALPMPEVDVLNGGLEILKTVDLRLPLQNVSMPFLRLYGYLDGLVPRKVVPMLDKLGRTASRTFSPKRPMRRLFRIRSSFITCWWR